MAQLEAAAAAERGGVDADGIPLDPDAAAAELDAAKARMEELKRRQAAGELTPEELAELLERKSMRHSRASSPRASLPNLERPPDFA